MTGRITRRDLLRAGTAAEATAVVAPGLLGRGVAAAPCLLPPGALPFPGRPAGQPQPDLAPELANIDHIFLVMMENKSFDAYFGMLPWARTTQGRLNGRVDGDREVDDHGRPTDTLRDRDGRWYPAYVGWGHSSIEHVVTLARRAEVGRLVLFHHDPYHSDDDLEAMHAQALRLWGDRPDPPVLAHEGMVIEV